MREEIIGPHRLILGDCLEVLPTLEAGSVDAVVTDPPYGIGSRLVRGGATSGGWHKMVTSGADNWDVKPPSEAFDHVFRVSKDQIIWGGNFFGLPPCDKPLCWDKVRPNQRNASEWEYAWTSLTGRAELFRHCANGGFILKSARVHPTQKPLPLLVWCLAFIPDAGTILDPFMGSGTTGVACAKLGRKFIGIEIEPKYFDIACRRVAAEVSQGKFEFAGPMI